MTTESEKCWACVQIADHYPEQVPMSALADVQGMDIPLCDRHWSWWVAYWMSPETGEPGVSAHVVNLPDPLPAHDSGYEPERTCFACGRDDVLSESLPYDDNGVGEELPDGSVICERCISVDPKTPIPEFRSEGEDQ